MRCPHARDQSGRSGGRDADRDTSPSVVPHRVGDAYARALPCRGLANSLAPALPFSDSMHRHTDPPPPPGVIDTVGRRQCGCQDHGTGEASRSSPRRPGHRSARRLLVRRPRAATRHVRPCQVGQPPRGRATPERQMVEYHVMTRGVPCRPQTAARWSSVTSSCVVDVLMGAPSCRRPQRHFVQAHGPSAETVEQIAPEQAPRGA